MVIILLVIFTLLTFITWINIDKAALRITTGTISLLLLLATAILMAFNFNNHYGMEKVTKTTTHEIYSAGGSKMPAGMLMAQALGSKSDNYVLVYADKEDGKAKPHFTPDQKHIIEAVKKSATYKVADVDKATVTTKTTRWEWRNDFFKLLFAVGGEGHSLAKQTSVVTVPKDTWVVMTPAQAKQVQKQQAAAATDPAAAQAQQAQMQAGVQAKVQAFMQDNPNASAQEVKDYTAKATATLMADAMKMMLK